MNKPNECGKAFHHEIKGDKEGYFTHCIRPKSHKGNHNDGEEWFDDYYFVRSDENDHVIDRTSSPRLQLDEKPNDMPQERWDNLSDFGKLWWIANIEKRGSYKAVVEWRKESASKRRLSTLSESDIKDIKNAPKSLSQLADEYGISPSYVSKIRNGWRLN